MIRLPGTGLALVLLLLATETSLARSLPDTIDRIRGSVVAVGTVIPIKYAPKKKPRAKYLGTGFVAGKGNLVVTNYHVVPEKLDTQKKEQLAVFSGRGKNARVHTAKVLRSDLEHDLALLQISGPALPTLELHGRGWLREGEEVAFTGFPIGMVLGLYPVTHKGIVSAITYPGNSGSPVYQASTGRVIGVLNSVFVKGSKESILSNPSGISYAIPVKYVHKLLKGK